MQKWRLHKNGYVYCFTDTRILFLHTEVLKAPKGMIVDHINRDRLDCRRTNLRIVTKSESQWNKGPYKTNRSGFKGVHWDKESGKWRAQIAYNGKRHTIGRYRTAKAAARAYDRVAKKVHGEFAYINLPKK